MFDRTEYVQEKCCELPIFICCALMHGIRKKGKNIIFFKTGFASAFFYKIFKGNTERWKKIIEYRGIIYRFFQRPVLKSMRESV
jgi:hypothetical protein